MIQLYLGNTSFGPGKVFANLTKGLKLLRSDYSVNTSYVNPELPAYCLSPHPILLSHSNLLSIGPNICVLPSDLPVVIEQKYKHFITPCEWTSNLYSRWIEKSKIRVWPVGIDTNDFQPSPNIKTQDCLLYLKNRPLEEVEEAKRILKKLNQNYSVLEYGKYKEEDFVERISVSRYCFVLGNTESQGIAIQEMMSCDLPLFVWDKTEWDHRGEEFKCAASTVPYWDKTCGIKADTNIEESFERFLDTIEDYNPRSYIENNFGLEKRASEFLDIK